MELVHIWALSCFSQVPGRNIPDEPAGLAIRRGDVLTHLDSVLTAYLTAAGIAIIRLFYFLCWTFVGDSPFTLVGMFFVTMIFVLILLTSSYALAGRLKNNVVILTTVIVINVLIAIFGVPYYKSMSVG